MRTGIMGGTFNPPHLGHLHAAECVKDALGLDKVLFVPTNLPPHKKMPAGSADTKQRCEMVERMLEGRGWAELSTIEIDRGGASYTIDTVRALYETREYGELFLIMGTDMLMMLDYGWREPQEICRLCTLAVVARGAGQQGEQKKSRPAAEKISCGYPFGRLPGGGNFIDPAARGGWRCGKWCRPEYFSLSSKTGYTHAKKNNF